MADYRSEARKAAERHGLDPGMFERQIQQESGFDPNARSKAGALGIAQLMPATAAGWGVDPHDPIASLDAAAKNMAHYVKAYGGVENALRAYNAGPGAIEKSHGYAETNAYVRTILGGHSPKAPVAASHTRPASRPQVGTPAVPSAPTAAPGVDAAAARRTALQQYVLAQGTQDQPGSLVNLARGLQAARETPDPAPPADAKTALRQRRAAPKAPSAPSAPATAHGGTVDFDGKKVAGWIGDALKYARAHGWKGTVNSGFRTDAEQTRIWNSGVRPAAKPRSLGGGGSNHSGTVYPLGAVDVSEAGQLSQILRDSPYGKKLEWAGAKDPVHFSHPHNGSY